MYFEKFLKLYKTISEFISCNASDVFARRALKGKLGSQRTLEGHLGTRALKVLGHSKDTWALTHSKHFI